MEDRPNLERPDEAVRQSLVEKLAPKSGELASRETIVGDDDSVLPVSELTDEELAYARRMVAERIAENEVVGHANSAPESGFSLDELTEIYGEDTTYVSQNEIDRLKDQLPPEDFEELSRRLGWSSDA